MVKAAKAEAGLSHSKAEGARLRKRALQKQERRRKRRVVPIDSEWV